MKDILIFALREAGKIQLHNFAKVHQVQQKESLSSIVTEVDILCDKIIVDAIRQKFPLHNIISEESGFASNGSIYTWVIDPLDGTSNFAAGMPWFGVLIALFENNIPKMAGAYLPIEDKLFFAEKGSGAFVNNKKLKIAEAELKNSLFAFSIDYTDDQAFLERGLTLYRFLIRNSRNIRSTNSLVDYLMVAENKLGGAINMFSKIWDIAAPWLIIKEAGGNMKPLDGEALEFEIDEKSLSRNYPVIAGSNSILKSFQ